MPNDKHKEKYCEDFIQIAKTKSFMCFGWRLGILFILPPTLEQRSEQIKRKERAKRVGETWPRDLSVF